MSRLRAVLFDFGGTLYDYASLEGAERESLLELAREHGVTADPMTVLRAYRDGMRRAFQRYLPQSYYLHRDLFRDAAVLALEALGAKPDADVLEGHRERQWARHARDFRLREGVEDTLRELRRRGLHLGIVSNIDDDQLQHLGSLARLEEFFDSILSSQAVGSCKPDQAIFAEAVRRADCAPGEALFVGDTLKQDVDGANRAGLRSVLLWHREDREPPQDGPRPQHVIRRIPDLLQIVGG